MAAGDPCEVLLWVADRLCAELGCAEEGGEAPDAPSAFGGDGGTVGALSPQDELLVAQVRRRLAQIAAALGSGPPLERGVIAALDGSELVMRGELVKGNRRQLLSTMPSFILLIALPIVDQDEALALSRRAAELVAATSSDG